MDAIGRDINADFIKSVRMVINMKQKTLNNKVIEGDI